MSAIIPRKCSSTIRLTTAIPPIFGQKNILPKIFGQKYSAKNIRPKIFGQKFSAKDFFDQKIFFAQKWFFRPKNIFSAKKYFFGQKIFFRPKNIFWAKMIFSAKHEFFAQKLFFCVGMIFPAENSFGRKFFWPNLESTSYSYRSLSYLFRKPNSWPFIGIYQLYTPNESIFGLFFGLSLQASTPVILLVVFMLLITRNEACIIQ